MSKNKIGLVIGREYFSRVKKKSFLLTTILVPIVIIGFYVAIIAISIKGGTDKKSIAVIDNGSLFKNIKAEEKKSDITYTMINNETEKSFVAKYKTEGYDAFLYIPPFSLDSPKNFIIHSLSSLSLSTTLAIERKVNKAIEDKRLLAQGLDPVKYEAISADVDLENTIDTKEGGKKSVAGVAYMVSFACGLLIYMMMMIYGTQVMRGVMEEKTNRIAEVIVSSVKPFQLMIGKIVGIGAVGLTQFLIWMVLLFSLASIIPLVAPGIMENVSKSGGQDTAPMVSEMMQGLSSLPLFKIAASFLFYFLGGYLTYASLFAAIGSVVNDDQQDAQQLVFPVLMPIILGFVIMTNAINQPDSNMAVFGSIFPLTSPIVMMGRITYDIPLWQLATSMLLLIGCFLFFTWLTAKIYRVGILMYGKKPSWKEMFKWAFKS